jgi:drug/metabolite transporter (DMT)-like permease
MAPRSAVLLAFLSAVWGASFMFIKLGVEELEPSVVVLGRLFFGSLVVLPLVLARGGLDELRHRALPVLFLSVFNNAIPFWLLGFAGARIDSGLSAEIQASAPLLTVLLARRLDPSQRVGGARLAGIAVGFAGVALLVGGEQGGELVGALAVIGTASCYAVSVLFAGRYLRDVPPAPLALGQIGLATLLVAPAGLAQLPGSAPSGGAIAAVVALGMLGTGFAYLLYFAIIQSAGASRAIIVTYLIPAFALVYGAVFLDEGVSPRQVGGLVLVLGGSALATGLAARSLRR